MPNDDSNKDKKPEDKSVEEDVKKTLEELKNSGMEMSEEDLKKFEKILTDMALKERESTLKKFFKSAVEYLVRFGLLYLISIIAMGFFYYFFVLENKWMILLVSLVVSFALTVIEMLFDVIISTKVNHPFALYMLFISVWVGFNVAFNYYYFKIFEFASIWIAYYIAVLVIYILLNFIHFKYSLKRGKSI